LGILLCMMILRCVLTPENGVQDVASSDYIRSLLKKEHFLGSSYNLAPEASSKEDEVATARQSTLLCDVTHLCVRCLCDVTHSCVCCLCDMTHLYVDYLCDVTRLCVVT